MKNVTRTEEVNNTLSNSEIHSKWIGDYFSKENQEFYRIVFEYLKRRFQIPNDAHILDVGCGSGNHSITLANIGFRVTGIDYSKYILEIAEKNITNAGLKNRISLLHGDILSLIGISDFDYVLCWGVLMHIPEYEIALNELIRILNPGGLLIISEVNMNSLQSRLHRILNKLRNKKQSIYINDYGVEQWWDSPSGKIIVRAANIDWLRKYFAKKNVFLIKRISGQLTELYTVVSNKYFLKVIYNLNTFWFKHIRIPNLAFGNILVFRKAIND